MRTLLLACSLLSSLPALAAEPPTLQTSADTDKNSLTPEAKAAEEANKPAVPQPKDAELANAKAKRDAAVHSWDAANTKYNDAVGTCQAYQTVFGRARLSADKSRTRWVQGGGIAAIAGGVVSAGSAAAAQFYSSTNQNDITVQRTALVFAIVGAVVAGVGGITAVYSASASEAESKAATLIDNIRSALADGQKQSEAAALDVARATAEYREEAAKVGEVVLAINTATARLNSASVKLDLDCKNYWSQMPLDDTVKVVAHTFIAEAKTAATKQEVFAIESLFLTLPENQAFAKALAAAGRLEQIKMLRAAALQNPLQQQQQQQEP